MFFAHRVRLAELAAQSRLPTVYLLREHVDAGGLMRTGSTFARTFVGRPDTWTGS